jgi:hypothetical protein
VEFAALIVSTILAAAAFIVERQRDRTTRRREFIVDRLLESYRSLVNTMGDLSPRERRLVAEALNDLQVFGSPELIVAITSASADATGTHDLEAIAHAVRHQLRGELGLRQVNIPIMSYQDV